MRALIGLLLFAGCFLSIAAQSTFRGVEVPSFCSIYLQRWNEASPTPCDSGAALALQNLGNCLLTTPSNDDDSGEETAAALQYAAEDQLSHCHTTVTYSSATPSQIALMSALGTKTYTTPAGWQIGGPGGASVLSSLDAAEKMTETAWETSTTRVTVTSTAPTSTAPTSGGANSVNRATAEVTAAPKVEADSQGDRTSAAVKKGFRQAGWTALGAGLVLLMMGN